MRASEVKARMHVALGKRDCTLPIEGYILSLERWYSTGEGMFHLAHVGIRKVDTGFPCAIHRQKITLSDDMAITDRRWVWEPCIAYPRSILGSWEMVRDERAKAQAKDVARGRAVREHSQWVDEMVGRLGGAGVEVGRVLMFDGEGVALRMSADSLLRLVALAEEANHD